MNTIASFALDFPAKAAKAKMGKMSTIDYFTSRFLHLAPLLLTLSAIPVIKMTSSRSPDQAIPDYRRRLLFWILIVQVIAMGYDSLPIPSRRAAFTLIELLVVIAIIAILI